VKLLSVVGARPQFVKIAPLIRAIEQRRARDGISLEHILLHTGQHYDAAMSDIFFSDLDLPEAHFNLSVGSGPHGRQTGLMLDGIEQALIGAKPDAIIVFGDTNSTLAGAIAGAKLHIPVAHVEAGLRSFNRRMPEEINRVLADHASDLLLAPTPAAMRNLEAEGLAIRSMFSGDIMLDATLHYRALANKRASIGTRLGIESADYGVVTLHRAENTDDPERLHSLLRAIDQIADEGLTLVFPLHPRTQNAIRSAAPDWKPHARVTLVAPVGYLDMLWLIDHGQIVLTDSGGLQKEAFFLGCPCVTLRDETEWNETVEFDGNIVAGTDAAHILDAAGRMRARVHNEPRGLSEPARDAFGDGNASARILNAIVQLAQSCATCKPGQPREGRHAVAATNH
jgi:UDP-GlcNAc3NAcA epimerase